MKFSTLKIIGQIACHGTDAIQTNQSLKSRYNELIDKDYGAKNAANSL